MRIMNCSIPNCVPEYNRSRFEDEAHEAEKEWERLTWYEKNKAYRRQKYIEGCNELRFYTSVCVDCPHGEEAMPDSEMDDIPTMICSNWKNCPVYRKDADEHFPTVPWKEYCSWREEYVEKLKKGESEW